MADIAPDREPCRPAAAAVSGAAALRPRAALRRAVGVLLILLAALAVRPASAASTPRRVAIAENTWASRRGDELSLEALPRRGEGMASFVQRFCGTNRKAAQAIAKANGRSDLLKGMRTRVPYELLTPTWQAKVAEKLFTADRATSDGWQHVVPSGAHESLWQIAEWLTGRGENWAALRAANGLDDESVRPGSRVLVPAKLLLPGLRAKLPAATVAKTAPAKAPAAAATTVAAAPAPDRTPATAVAAPAKTPVAASMPRPTPAKPAPAAGRGDAAVLAAATSTTSAATGDEDDDEELEDGEVPAAPLAGTVVPASLPIEPAPGIRLQSVPPPALPGPTDFGTGEDAVRLTYVREGDRDYAVYRLRPHEALYSSVVMRFTGRIHAEDVNALATEIARASGIVDVTSIPVGYPVKISLDLLLPEYLPAGDARRREYEEERSEAARFSNQVTARGLAGVTIVLDAGHGGRDVGASLGGVWESLHVYDIMIRVKRLLEARTAAQVIATTRDANGFAVPDRDVLAFSRTHAVLTTPAYPIDDPKVGVHLRWYLANSVFRKAVAKRVDPEKLVFLSIHADSLHPSLRGAMVYIPGAHNRGGEYGKVGSVYSSRAEVREQPRVSFTQRELVQSEGLSRDLAQHLVDAFERRDLAVHPFNPIRDTVIRNRREWVPAVLRYNEIPAKILLEVCNLANDEDRRLVQTREYREQVAEAVVDALLRYYGGRQQQPPPDLQLAKKAK